MEFIHSFIDGISWQAVSAAVARIFMVLILAWGAMFAARIVLHTLQANLINKGAREGEPSSESAKRADTLIRLLRQGIHILIWMVAFLVLLSEVGIDIGPVLAGAGVVGLAVGFGAQNLVRDVISGFFIIMENQVRVGDVAVVNGTGGLVENVNFRTMVLRDASGTVHVFPNGTISTLANKTKEWSAHVFEIGVAYKEEIDNVINVLKGVGAELRDDPEFGPMMIEDVEIFGLDQFGDSAVIIKGRLKTVPMKQWSVGREFLRRVKIAFDREGIEIPFPHRSIYFGDAGKPVIPELSGQ